MTVKSSEKKSLIRPRNIVGFCFKPTFICLKGGRFLPLRLLAIVCFPWQLGPGKSAGRDIWVVKFVNQKRPDAALWHTDAPRANVRVPLRKLILKVALYPVTNIVINRRAKPHPRTLELPLRVVLLQFVEWIRCIFILDGFLCSELFVRAMLAKEVQIAMSCFPLQRCGFSFSILCILTLLVFTHPF